jgi:hypothetical protein
MNVPLIEMDPAQAREELRTVRKLLHRRADEEYEVIEKGLAALEKGHRVLSLQAALRAGGFDELGRPRLAISRADRRHIRFMQHRDSTVGEFDARARDRWGRHRGALWPTLAVNVDLGRRPAAGKVAVWLTAYALVPMIPPRVRDEVRFQDRDCFILWEVEEWAESPLQAVPDRDPYLLKHLGGDAYAVLAEWDLTELERMVMAGRAQA